ncbi:hypothetical protein [Nostoc sp. NMS4]|uniref:hypothetical protein n=1 Tax=Nostoc sp. NMS4 TaxID=2815390 RepID=UPI0025EDE0A4|nr:hypothetical protein [Nostoc sp. NMS4]MBN3926456.1 hypothetical protein [Nostoc sp. NMS4]
MRGQNNLLRSLAIALEHSCSLFRIRKDLVISLDIARFLLGIGNWELGIGHGLFLPHSLIPYSALNTQHGLNLSYPLTALITQHSALLKGMGKTDYHPAL